MDTEQLFRFAAKVTWRGHGCWEWAGATFAKGYAAFSVRGKPAHAARLAFEHWRGPIRTNQKLHRSCHNRTCVNPWHMEPFTQTDIQSCPLCRSGSANARKQSCPQGHPYAPDNVFTETNRRGLIRRHCRTCGRESTLRYRKNKHLLER